MYVAATLWSMDISEIARQLVGQRKREAHTCQRCAATFTAYTGAKYCSPKCRQAAVRARRKQVREAASHSQA